MNKTIGKLLALLRNGEMYGYQLSVAYKKRYGQEMPIGTMYEMMREVGSAGLVSSRLDEKRLPERGGNRRLFWSLTAKGLRSLDMADGLVARGVRPVAGGDGDK